MWKGLSFCLNLLHLSVKLYFTQIGKTYNFLLLISHKILICPLICSFLLFNTLFGFQWPQLSLFCPHSVSYLFSRWRVKSEKWRVKRWIFAPQKFLVGSSGLEPPTSRLSGARSNHLSYEPIQFSVYLVHSQPVSLYRPFRRVAIVLRTLALRCLASIFDSWRCQVVEMMGIEPMTPCLQGRCSPSWATPP